MSDNSPLFDKDVYMTLGRLEGKVDAILTAQNNHTEKQAEHDKRIGTLEKGWAKLTGIGLAAGALGGAGGYKLLELLNG